MLFTWLFLALFSLSTSPIWVRIAANSAAIIGFWRLLGAALVLLLITRAKKLRIWEFQTREEMLLSLFAGFCFFLHLWTYVISAQTTSIAHLVMIFSSAPLFTALGAAIFFREPFPPRLWGIYAIAGAGILLLFNNPLSAKSKLAVASSFSGNMAAVASAAFHAAYALVGKKVRRTLPNLNFSFSLYWVSGLCFLVLAVFSNWQSLPDLAPTYGNFYLAIAGLILLPSLLGHTLYTYLLKFININILSCAKLAEPAISTFIAFLLFGEEIGPRTLIAFAFIGGSVLWLFAPAISAQIRARSSGAKKT